MDVGAKTGLADAHQQLPERGIARQTGAQGQSIDEAADHSFQRRLAAVRNGCADGDVVESCVAGEKDLECRQQYRTAWRRRARPTPARRGSVPVKTRRNTERRGRTVEVRDRQGA